MVHHLGADRQALPEGGAGPEEDFVETAVADRGVLDDSRVRIDLVAGEVVAEVAVGGDAQDHRGLPPDREGKGEVTDVEDVAGGAEISLPVDGIALEEADVRHEGAYLLFVHSNPWQIFLVCVLAEALVFLSCNIKKRPKFLRKQKKQV